VRPPTIAFWRRSICQARLVSRNFEDRIFTGPRELDEVAS
jgi:hypothetical protein